MALPDDDRDSGKRILLPGAAADTVPNERVVVQATDTVLRRQTQVIAIVLKTRTVRIS
jgi:hypothetical protein